MSVLQDQLLPIATKPNNLNGRMHNYMEGEST